MEQETHTIQTEAKFGILTTITNAIYATPKLKLKEAVTNAKDNNATKMLISYNSNTNTLTLLDDGDGLNIESLQKIFSSIGYSEYKQNENKYSHFGLGLFSVFSLGSMVEIYSVQQGSGVVCTFNSAEVFSQDNEDKPLSLVANHIKVFNSDEYLFISDLQDKSKELITNSSISYTEIKIIGINSVSKSYFQNIALLKKEMSMVLPVRPMDNEPFFENIIDEDQREEIKKISGVYGNSPYVSFVDIFYEIVRSNNSVESNELDTDYSFNSDIFQIYKYYPNFTDLFFNKGNITIKESENDNWAGYIVYIPEDLHNYISKENKDTIHGLWLRNRGTLVEKNAFLECEDYKSIDNPVKRWIFGEIFHKHMENFLYVTRDSVIEENASYKKFCASVHSSLFKDINDPLRAIYDTVKSVKTSIIEPLISINTSKSNILNSIQSKLESINIDINNIDPILDEIYTNNQVLERDVLNYVDNLLDVLEEDMPFLQSKTKQYIVLMSISRNKQIFRHNEYIKTDYEKDSKTINIKIDADIFRKKDNVQFLGDKYSVNFVMGESNKSFAINKRDKKIFINILNEFIAEYSLTILDVMIAFEIAYAQCKDSKEDLRRLFYRLLKEPVKGNSLKLVSLFKVLSER